MLIPLSRSVLITLNETISLKEYSFGTPGLPLDDCIEGTTKSTLSQYLSWCDVHPERKIACLDVNAFSLVNSYSLKNKKTVYTKYTWMNQFCLELSWFLIRLYIILRFHSVIFSERKSNLIFVTNK